MEEALEIIKKHVEQLFSERREMFVKQNQLENELAGTIARLTEISGSLQELTAVRDKLTALKGAKDDQGQKGTAT